MLNLYEFIWNYRNIVDENQWRLKNKSIFFGWVQLPVGLVALGSVGRWFSCPRCSRPDTKFSKCSDAHFSNFQSNQRKKERKEERLVRRFYSLIFSVQCVPGAYTLGLNCLFRSFRIFCAKTLEKDSFPFFFPLFSLEEEQSHYPDLSVCANWHIFHPHSNHSGN
jgi:hypothetical protein